MNAKDKARRVEALNIDYINRRSLCEMIANREADLEDAIAERDALRAEVEALRRALWDRYGGDA